MSKWLGCPHWVHAPKALWMMGNLQVGFTIIIIILFAYLNKLCGLGRAGKVVSLDKIPLKVKIAILQLAPYGKAALVPLYGHMAKEVKCQEPPSSWGYTASGKPCESTGSVKGRQVPSKVVEQALPHLPITHLAPIFLLYWNQPSSADLKPGP